MVVVDVMVLSTVELPVDETEVFTVPLVSTLILGVLVLAVFALPLVLLELVAVVGLGLYPGHRAFDCALVEHAARVVLYAGQ